MPITDEQKEHLTFLLETGEQLEAVQYAQESLGLNAEQALAFVKRLEDEIKTQDELEFDAIRVEHEKISTNLPRMLGMIFSTIGLILLGLGLFFGNREYNFGKRAERISGKVLAYEKVINYDSAGRPMTMFAPLIEYQLQGKTIQYHSTTSYSNPPYEVDELVPLLVDPAHPREPEIDSFFDRWFLTTLLSFIGLIFTAAGYVIMRFL
ncbi:MAG: DUF3592 domain-containing protein [Cyclobacteriaceae bacterium]|nr:DUF3592 domain-containing protein [Cyclobacteriaceae bacterium]